MAIATFLDTEGGDLLVGVADDGSIVIASTSGRSTDGGTTELATSDLWLHFPETTILLFTDAG